MKQETKNVLSSTFERTLGITYEELINMDPDEVQELISEYKKNKPKKTRNYSYVMFGYGEYAIFRKVKKGTRVMIGYGNFTEAGLTPEESRQRLNDRVDDVIYGKPNTFAKKLKRKIQQVNSRM